MRSRRTMENVPYRSHKPTAMETVSRESSDERRIKMAESGCATCSFRAKNDAKPKSILGRLWRWHANFCPGWKSYMKSLPDEERQALIVKYDFPPNKFAS